VPDSIRLGKTEKEKALRSKVQLLLLFSDIVDLHPILELYGL
jgi:hypothetical protein